MRSTRAERSRVHAALADPIRLAIVDELHLSDRSPSELVGLLDVGSNLLAHHLDVLAAVGLIERLESAGDRRRRYVRLQRAPLVDLVARSTPSPPEMLFVCTHNSARSQLAAALWRRRIGTPAASAGTHPAERVHPGAVKAGVRAGVDLSSARPRSLDEVDGAGRAELQVVTVCDRAHEELHPESSWWHWSIRDPLETASAAAFDAVVDDIQSRLAPHAVVQRRGPAARFESPGGEA